MSIVTISIITLYIILPLNSHLFLFLTSILSAYIGCKVHILMKNKKYKDAIIIPGRFILLLYGFYGLLFYSMIFIGLNGYKLTQHIIALYLAVITILITISSLTEVFYRAIKLLRKINIMKRSDIFFMIFMIITVYVFPEFIFGICYNLLFLVYTGSYVENPFYLSFVISNTLPITNTVLLNNIDTISSYELFRIVQISQVIFGKLSELIVIGLVAGMLIDYLKTRKSKK